MENIFSKSQLLPQNPSNKSLEQFYQALSKKRIRFGRYHKCLFHVHTPASYDYRFTCENAEEYAKLNDEEIEQTVMNILDIPKEFLPDLQDIEIPTEYINRKEYLTYISIAAKLFIESYELAVVTDHNTITGYPKLKIAVQEVKKLKEWDQIPSIIPGIEITCAERLHVIGIFSERTNNVNTFYSVLKETLVGEIEGTYKTSIDILKEINEVNGVGYIAHIDTSDIFKSGYLTEAYKKQLFSQMGIVGITSSSKKDVIQERISKISNGEKCFVIDNDAHSLDEMNTKFFFLKGQKCNFGMIKDAVRDYSIAIEFDRPSVPTKYIKGMLVNSGEDAFLKQKDDEATPFSLIFSDSLNCFIGGRGTGKSTSLHIISLILSQQYYNKMILDFLCHHTVMWLLCEDNGTDYMVCFNSPDRNIVGRNIWIESDYYRAKEISNKEMKNKLIKGISVYKRKSADLWEKVSDKDKWLESFYRQGYSVNELVRSASDGTYTKFIENLLYRADDFKEDCPIPTISSRDQFKRVLDTLNDYLRNREQKMMLYLEKYNQREKRNLRIDYNIKIVNDQLLEKIEKYFSQLGSERGWFKKTNLPHKHLLDIALIAMQEHTPLKVLSECLKGSYKELFRKIDLKDFCKKMTPNMVEGGLRELTATDYDSVYTSIAGLLLKREHYGFWRDWLKEFVANCETYRFLFNANNYEGATGKDTFLEIEKLSLGQKVVAMLSLLISYGEYSNDSTPLVIDQPEDNLDNQYIYRHLVKDLKKIKSKRQVIIATHSSTIVTNAKAEQVIVMQSDCEHGWVERTGYPTETKIIRSIVNCMEGGVESFNHKTIQYADVLATLC